MLTFGHATPIDLLSWIVVLALGAKVVATVAVLAAGREVRDRPGWGSVLWWVTKVTPVIAVPCLIGIAVLEADAELVRLFCGLAVFVAVAVPIAVHRRRRRIALSRS